MLQKITAALLILILTLVPIHIVHASSSMSLDQAPLGIYLLPLAARSESANNTKIYIVWGFTNGYFNNDFRCNFKILTTNNTTIFSIDDVLATQLAMPYYLALEGEQANQYLGKVLKTSVQCYWYGSPNLITESDEISYALPKGVTVTPSNFIDIQQEIVGLTLSSAGYPSPDSPRDASNSTEIKFNTRLGLNWQKIVCEFSFDNINFFKTHHNEDYIGEYSRSFINFFPMISNDTFTLYSRCKDTSLSNNWIDFGRFDFQVNKNY